MLSYDKGFHREAACKKFDLSAYEKARKKSFTIISDFGYPISCEILEPLQRESRWNSGSFSLAVLCHGFGCAKYHSLKYAEIFLELGLSVLIYDHRNHGLSGKAYTSMGYYERYDLKKVLDWCYLQYGENCRIVTHGESMGAATVLLHLGIDSRVKCAIADCAYSDLKQELRHQLKQYYHLPCLLIPIESGLTYLRAGFWYREISPMSVMRDIETPVMFIHGKRDNLVPANMSKLMYSLKKDKKAIYLVAGARHGECVCKNRAGYKMRVENFLKKYL
jgi:fermentation-respiration switch protein FrsA (DUF1100 family)